MLNLTPHRADRGLALLDAALSALRDGDSATAATLLVAAADRAAASGAPRLAADFRALAVRCADGAA
jgi:hypothetical protein